MNVNRTFLRVRYAETDQMGVVYYGNYAQYFEVGRTEALRAAGSSYRQLEAEGIMLPVKRLEINYRAPALYDDELCIETWVEQIPTARIVFHHCITNEKNQVLITGSVELVFVDRETRRPRRCPEHLSALIKANFGLRES